MYLWKSPGLLGSGLYPVRFVELMSTRAVRLVLGVAGALAMLKLLLPESPLGFVTVMLLAPTGALDATSTFAIRRVGDVCTQEFKVMPVPKAQAIPVW